ncbi:DUF4835 family protein [Dysgonomonas sp. 216]|uniref:type IX secretion system protein PorD n=1 Tax=Dysgonomonas sp. 216 TaxID=2302934 RepID=UPI0013D4220A|nr:DUF4835 family protein [Dysgonomonas sp. 216]NDW18013.1 DUF4835 family protein [Dysgonomonas sp. 216]
MLKYILIILFSFFVLSSQIVKAQELNAKVTINSAKIQGVDKEVFTSLEGALMQLLNEKQWTSNTFSMNERIDCNFVFTLNSVSDGSTYLAELQVNSRRPVYNATYATPMFNYKDVDVEFSYTQGEQLEYNENMIENNLVAIVAFYANIILGIDFDSFSLNGGKTYFQTAMNIVNISQSLNTKGWTPFENDRNRYALALALSEDGSVFHQMWYDYHRLGLDEMSSNVSRGRTKILTSLGELQKIYSSRPSSPIFLFYGDAKLKEIVDICSESSNEEKKTVYEQLRKIYPTRTSELNKLKN